MPLGSCGKDRKNDEVVAVMLTCQLNGTSDKPLTVLCLGAHSDDIEIGCGGTILKLVEAYQQLSINWIVFSASKQRRQEAKDSAHAFLHGVNQKIVVIKNFRDGFFPYSGRSIKGYFEELKTMPAPDIIFTHYRLDLHQDHRLISELAWQTFRDHLILEYEIPKYDGDYGNPNCFVHLSGSICDKKVQYIVKYFESQRANHWFGEETFRSLLRLRGIESNARSKYAEAFYCRKFVV
jgi:LmbE family N-acetylglucosaminyl deacetylase